MDAGGRGTHEQDPRRLLSLQGGGRGGLGLLYLLLNFQAVLLIQIGPSGDIRARLQHAHIVLKTVHVEIQHVQAGALQRLLHLHLALRICAGDDEICFQTENGLGTDLLIAAQIRNALIQLKVEILPGVLRRRDQFSAGQHPGLGKAAYEHGHTLRPRFQRHFAVQIVLYADSSPFVGRFSLPRLLGSGFGVLFRFRGSRLIAFFRSRGGRFRGLCPAGDQHHGAQQRRQDPHILFHGLFSSAFFSVISRRSASVSSGPRGLPL